MTKKKSYQQVKDELEQIIARLESDDIDIDEAAKLYKDGQKLAADIEKYLKNIAAKLDITKPKS